MPYSDPVKMAEYMRQYRKRKPDKVNVNHVNPDVNRKPIDRKPVNHNLKTSLIAGSYENGLWVGICPVCNFHNKMDPKRTYRPAEKCNHFHKLLDPGKASEFVFIRGRVNTSSVNRKPSSPLTVNPNVNPVIEKYLLSYSRNKYQFVLYSIDPKGNKSLIKSCRKNETIKLGPCEIELTWGPEPEMGV